MLKLNVQVPEPRNRTAIATLRDGFNTIATDHAVASATPALAAQHANPSCDPLRPWGHPPLGSYRLLHHEPAQPDQSKEYGSHLLLFEPESGPALEAESFGRLALLVYGGAADHNRKMRRTQGGLRLGARMLDAVVKRLHPGEELTLELVPLRDPSWWQFWKPKTMATRHLSDFNLLDPFAPPADEVSLLEELLRKSVRRSRRPMSDDRDDVFERDRRDDRTSASTGSRPEVFQGKGGEFAGGGASAGWTDAPGRGTGVDSAGRIIGTAAAAGALAAVASVAASAGSREPDAGGADSGEVGSGSSTDTSTDTSTATTY
ncbi:MAG: hypothetical protein HY322_09595 [Betaproteobacteria bacterium]|nr:hypothetical protein [Betaproteobacteria bacterium]